MQVKGRDGDSVELLDCCKWRQSPIQNLGIGPCSPAAFCLGPLPLPIPPLLSDGAAPLRVFTARIAANREPSPLCSVFATDTAAALTRRTLQPQGASCWR